MKGHTRPLRGFGGRGGEEKAHHQLVGPGQASGRRWAPKRAWKGGQISWRAGGGAFQAGTGVGWSKVGLGDGDWPDQLGRRVI